MSVRVSDTKKVYVVCEGFKGHGIERLYSLACSTKKAAMLLCDQRAGNDAVGAWNEVSKGIIERSVAGMKKQQIIMQFLIEENK